MRSRGAEGAEQGAKRGGAKPLAGAGIVPCQVEQLEPPRKTLCLDALLHYCNDQQKQEGMLEKGSEV